MKTGVVITYGADRIENVNRTLDYLDELVVAEPEAVILVLDGHSELPDMRSERLRGRLGLIKIAKHEPGQEQPRNVGVRVLREVHPDVTHAWFLDSDILVRPNCLQFYEEQPEDAILIGPYEWMPPGVTEPIPDLHNDPRWEMFLERAHEAVVADLGVALGCFGGNLVWPIAEFTRIGGFHPMLYHGRCEDGELGLRAAAHRIPMVLVPDARGFHVSHPVNHELAFQRNQRDVPLLNSWHPWVQEKGLIVTDQDGARFDFACACGQQVNTLEMWRHMAQHAEGEAQPDLAVPHEAAP